MQGKSPRVGFVSLGCPKALVDSERILTQLRIRGYEISPSYETADLVVVNTCGFIDSAIDESLEAIGEALEANGKVIVTGCLGANPQRIRDQHPEGAGRHRSARHRTGARGRECAPAPAPRPVQRPGPGAGHPAHAAPLRLSEDFRRLQQQVQLLHHPVTARPAGFAAAGRRDAGSRAAGRCRRQGTAGDLAGHQRLWRGPALSRHHAARRETTRPASWTWRARWARWASGCACTMSTLTRMSTTCCR